MLINAVYPKGPADAAGIRVGDIIEAIGKYEVLDPEGLEFRIATRPPDSRVQLMISRGSEKFKTTVNLGPPPEVPKRQLSWVEGGSPLAGAQVGNLSPAFAEELGLDLMLQGVVIIEVAARSPARRLRLRPGDIIVSVNGAKIERTDDVLAAVQGDEDEWRIGVKRGDRLSNVVIRQ